MAEDKLRAAFLDRDGVLTELVKDHQSGQFESPYREDDVVLKDGVFEALEKLDGAGFALIVVSNQPSVAKGIVSREELDAVERRFESLIRDSGVRLADIKYCYHHPDASVDELRGKCGCRKPEPGMLLQAAKAYEIDLTGSWMIGDADRDIIAGARVGCKTVLVFDPLSEHRRDGSSKPDHVVASILEAAKLVANDRIYDKDLCRWC